MDGYADFSYIDDEIPHLNIGRIIQNENCIFCDNTIKNKIKQAYHKKILRNKRNETQWNILSIPSVTFFEEICHIAKVHPISVFKVIKEGIEKEGWRSISEEQRIIKDQLTVIVLRLLGHNWSVSQEPEESTFNLVDPDGIIPLIALDSDRSLFELIKNHYNTQFNEGYDQFSNLFLELIKQSIEDWVLNDFFKHHTQQFKKRPIAWQIQSKPTLRGAKPVFSCLVYYHKLDKDTLPKIRMQYIGPMLTAFKTENQTLSHYGELSVDQAGRKTMLQNIIEELEAFDNNLHSVIETGFYTNNLPSLLTKKPLDKWNSVDGILDPPSNIKELITQAQRYYPDLNDGVRVNISPLQRIGLLAETVLSSKDAENAIKNRAVWRVDERRLCREGKLLKPGYWK